MMVGTFCITGIQKVIERRNAVFDITDRPVVANVQIVKSAGLDSGILGGSHGVAQKFSTVNRIVRPSV